MRNLEGLKLGWGWNKKPKIKKTCYCGNVFEVPPCLDRVKSCSRSCKAKLLYDKNKFTTKGRTAWNKGKKLSEEHRKKLSEAKIGKIGPLCPNWRGGSGSLRHQAMQRYEYIQWRKKVFERDNYTCKSCGKSGVYLHADHIKEWSKFPNLRLTVSNGQTLCTECHYLKTFKRVKPSNIIWGISYV